MENKGSPSKPLKRSRRFKLALSAIVLLALLSSLLVLYWYFVVRDNYGPGPIEIEVIPDNSPFAPGELSSFRIYVFNPHDWPVPHQYDTHYKITQGDKVINALSILAEPPPGPVQTYPPHSRTFSHTYTWNQKTYVNKTFPLVQVEHGNYTLTVTFGGLVDYGEGGNCTFEIGIKKEK